MFLLEVSLGMTIGVGVGAAQLQLMQIMIVQPATAAKTHSIR